MDQQVCSTSQTQIPAEIKGWNWGAFLLNWIWGIGNNVWVALLCLVPCFVPIMVFVLGIKGNEWAWRNKKWESVEQFKRVQRIWGQVGLGVLTFGILFAIGIIFFTFYVIKQGDAYQSALVQVRNNPQAIEMLGEPIEEGWYVTGNINTSGASGSADIAFPVSGPKGKGTVYVDATKNMGQWKFNGLVLTIDGTGKSISLIPSGPEGGW